MKTQRIRLCVFTDVTLYLSWMVNPISGCFFLKIEMKWIKISSWYSKCLIVRCWTRYRISRSFFVRVLRLKTNYVVNENNFIVDHLFLVSSCDELYITLPSNYLVSKKNIMMMSYTKTMPHVHRYDTDIKNTDLRSFHYTLSRLIKGLDWY